MQTTPNYHPSRSVPAEQAPASSVAVGRSLAPVALLTLEATAVTSLHRLGSVGFLRLPSPDASAWREWMQLGNPADVLVALARVAALGAAWWLLVSTILYLAARLHRSARGVRLVGRLVPAGVRRLVDGVVVVSVAGALAGGRTGVASAGASSLPSAGWTAAVVASVTSAEPSPPGMPASEARPDRRIVLRADLGRGIVYPLAPPDPGPAAPADPAVPPDAPVSQGPVTPAPAGSSSDVPPLHHQVVPGGTPAPDALLTASPALAPPPSPPEPAGAPPTAAGGQQAQGPPGASSPPGVPLSAGDAREGPAVWTVQPGDSLWALAARGVGAERSDDRRIGPYWVQVVAENRGRVASRDPDLIRPGEAIVMPPLTPPATDGR